MEPVTLLLNTGAISYDVSVCMLYIYIHTYSSYVYVNYIPCEHRDKMVYESIYTCVFASFMHLAMGSW